MVANLAPRKDAFGISEGMTHMCVAARSPGGKRYLPGPDEGAKPGQRVKVSQVSQALQPPAFLLRESS